MQANEIFELVLRKAKSCEANEHENHYLFITRNIHLEYIQSVLSYTELYNVLNKYIEEYSAFNDMINKPTPPDPKYYKTTLTKTDCVTHAAVCLPLGPCLLSNYEDSLLLVFYRLNSIRRVIFEDIFPDMKFKSVYYNDNMPSFRIEPVPCYWYAKCAFSYHIKSPYHDELNKIGLNQTIKLGKEVISKIKYDKLPIDELTTSPLFLCYASGECNLFSLKEFYKNELQRAVKKLEKYNYLFGTNFNLTSRIELHNERKPFVMYAKPIFIYIDQNGYANGEPKLDSFSTTPIRDLDFELDTLYGPSTWLYSNLFADI